MTISKARKILKWCQKQIPHQIPAILKCIKFKRILPQNFLLIKVPVNDREIINQHMGQTFSRINGCCHAHQCRFTRQSIFKKVLRLYRRCQKHIIIKQHKMLTQVSNMMQPQLNDIGVECRKILLRDILPMLHQSELRMIRFQPLRNLTAGHKKDSIDPWRIFFNSSEPVAHQIPVPVSIDTGRTGLILRLKSCLLPLPLRIFSIYP